MSLFKKDPAPSGPTNELRPQEVQAEPFNVWDPRIIKQIDDLVSLADVPGGVDNGDLVREMIVTSLKAQYSQLDRGDVKILSRALRELRYGFRVFKDYRERRKVSIFGSARTPVGHAEYTQAKDFAKRMAKADWMVITGAGPGVMMAGNEGAGKGNSFGIAIRLPFEQSANEFVAGHSLFIDCRFFFTRKLMFLKEASATAFFAGGFGTHDEGMETLTLMQTGKCDPFPALFIEVPGSGYWKDWEKYIHKHMLKTKKISPADLSLYKVTDSVPEAVKEIQAFYKNYHSMRYVKDQLVIRLQRELPGAALERLNTEFKDICAKGAFRSSPALSEEQEHMRLPRVVFQFPRRHFGRLRQLIDVLNQY